MKAEKIPYAVDNPVYKLIVNNIKARIRSFTAEDRMEDNGQTCFGAANTLSIGFCISPDRALLDLTKDH